MIPMKMRLKVQELEDEQMKGVNLWIPLLFVWILLSPVILLIFVTWLFLRLLGLSLDGPRNVARFIEAGVNMLSKIDGLQIDVSNRDSRFILHF